MSEIIIEKGTEEALSGILATTDYDGRYYVFRFTATQNVSTNTSTVSYELMALGGNSTWYVERDVYIYVNGSTIWSKSNAVNRYTGKVKGGSFTLTHKYNGTCSFTVGVRAAVHYGSINCTGNKTFTLNSIYRNNSLSFKTGTLGAKQTLTIKKQVSSFTSHIVAKYDKIGITVADRTSDTTVEFTLPIEWSKYNTNGTRLVVKYIIYTYDVDTFVGSETYEDNCIIPETTETKPFANVTTFEDATGIAQKFLCWVQNKSKIRFVIEPELKYGATLQSIEVNVDGRVYTEKSFTTEVIKNSGSQEYNIVLVDSRGIKGITTVGYYANEYADPKITKLEVHRCNQDGTLNSNGNYVQVMFSSVVTDINSRNTATYKLKYKRVGEVYTEVELTEYKDNLSVTNGTYIFSADTDSTYDVVLEVTDGLGTISISSQRTIPTVFKLFSWLHDGMGWAFGKIAELTGVVEIALKTKMTGGIIYPTLQENTNLDDVKDSNIYIGKTMQDGNYINCPLLWNDVRFILEVVNSNSTNQVRQIITPFYHIAGDNVVRDEKYERMFDGRSWSKWYRKYEIELFNSYSGSVDTITLPETCSNFKYLDIYFSNDNGISGGYTRIYNPERGIFVLSLVDYGKIAQEDNGATFIDRTEYKINGNLLVPQETTWGRIVIVNKTTKFYSDKNFIKIKRVVGYEKY